jgi:hypothetical protein
VDVPGDIPLEVPPEVAGEYTILGSHIEFYGLCAPCKKLKRKK